MDGEMATKRLVKLREENKARMEGIDRDWVDEMSREIDSADIGWGESCRNEWLAWCVFVDLTALSSCGAQQSLSQTDITNSSSRIAADI